MALFSSPPERLPIEALGAILKQALHLELIEVIVKQQLEEFEAKVRPLIEEEVQKLSLDTVQQYRNMLNMTDQYNLKIDWRNPPEPK